MLRIDNDTKTENCEAIVNDDQLPSNDNSDLDQLDFDLRFNDIQQDLKDNRILPSASNSTEPHIKVKFQ